jgi:pyruvate/2-oxoglutarate dehydrogenase complex dihydrolipoamide acyltransferase (E2) component
MLTEEVRYVGPYPEMELVLPDGGEVVVEQGETATVPMSVAENLVAQETWEYVGDGPPEIGATDGAKKLAAEHNIDLDNVEGSGKDGRVTKEDVEAAIEETAGGDGDSSGEAPGEEN